MSGGLLAFDLGMTIGITWGPWLTSVSASPPALVVRAAEILPGDYGYRFRCCENEIINALDEFEPDAVVKEAPIAKNERTTQHVLRLHHGFHAHLEQNCSRRNIPCIEYSADNVRNEVLGRCRRTKAEIKANVTMKDIVQAGLLRMGYRVTNHNAADALATYIYAVTKLDNHRRST